MKFIMLIKSSLFNILLINNLVFKFKKVLLILSFKWYVY